MLTKRSNTGVKSPKSHNQVALEYLVGEPDEGGKSCLIY